MTQKTLFDPNSEVEFTKWVEILSDYGNHSPLKFDEGI